MFFSHTVDISAIAAHGHAGATADHFQPLTQSLVLSTQTQKTMRRSDRYFKALGRFTFLSRVR